jgi:hypothetical protein
VSAGFAFQAKLSVRPFLFGLRVVSRRAAGRPSGRGLGADLGGGKDTRLSWPAGTIAFSAGAATVVGRPDQRSASTFFTPMQTRANSTALCPWGDVLGWPAEVGTIA